MSDAFGGAVAAVRSAERVHDEQIERLCQQLAELGIVLLLLGVEARVLQQQQLAGLLRRDGRFDLGADALGHETHRMPQPFFHVCADLSQ